MEKKALLLDEFFSDGFKVHGSRHEDGYIGNLRWPNNNECLGEGKSSDETPAWELAQWACRYNIFEGKWNGNSCETVSQKVALDIQEGQRILELQLHAGEEYENVRQSGMDWPHLLIEQHMGERCPTLDKICSLEFVSEVKVAYCDCCMESPNPALHAAQANLFLTIHNIENGNMYWFGIPYFDNRFEMQEAYLGEDGGKEDASHKLIYIIPQNRLTTKSFHGYEWITYQRNIYPDILEGLKLAVDKGYLETNDCSKYRITSMNFGWEMPGAYNGDLYIRKLSLTAERKHG